MTRPPHRVPRTRLTLMSGSSLSYSNSSGESGRPARGVLLPDGRDVLAI
jgi:hypothetical protein